MGNAVVPDRNKPGELETEDTQNVTDISRRFDASNYLTPHSDIVSLMVLEHQTHLTNLITRVGYEARLALHSQVAINNALGNPAGELTESTKRRIDSAAAEFVDYMLFADEAVLTEPIAGGSGFTKVFASSGPRDQKGRSLRDLDLTKRLFKYPCSYMIYSEAFDNMPEVARDRIYRGLWEVLSGTDKSAKFARLSTEDRKAILEILRQTKKGLPSYWSTT
jgi:hypothetical protein